MTSSIIVKNESSANKSRRFRHAPWHGQATGQQGMRPGSAARAPTAARLGTGMGQFGMVGGVAVPSTAARPVTQQGLAGVRTATAGLSGRMVQDASYFIGVIRSKIDDILAEINRMRSDLERSAKEGTVGAALEKKYEALLKEVRGLEGDLADYNLAMDKARSNVDVSEINGYYMGIKRRNEALSREIDSVFLERQQRERGAARLEEAIGDLQRVAEERISSLAPAQVAQYRSLTEANREVGVMIGRLQSELEHTNAAIENGEAALRRDTTRDEYAILEKRMQHLAREKAALEEEMEATRLDPAAARDKLLSKVREENARLQALDRQLKEVEDANAARRKAVAELSQEIEERKGEAGDSAKYEQLFKRDQEMTEFIDRFPDMKSREAAEHARLGHAIAALLEHISDGVEREGLMPSASQAEEMKEDLADKQRELKASEMTADRLREELNLRQAELEKISTLDTKIGQELTGMTSRMTSMRSDLSRFADLDGLRKAAEEAKAQLQDKIEGYGRRREAARPALQAASAEYEKKRSALSRDPQAQALEGLETKLKAQEQAVFQLKEFIASKGLETDYGPVKDVALRMLAELNLLVQKQAVDGPR